MTLCNESDYIILVSSLHGTLGNCAMILPIETALTDSRFSAYHAGCYSFNSKHIAWCPLEHLAKSHRSILALV